MEALFIINVRLRIDETYSVYKGYLFGQHGKNVCRFLGTSISNALKANLYLER